MNQVQQGNYRRREQQILDKTGTPWDLTGATGKYVLTAPDGTKTTVSLVLGKFVPTADGNDADIANGWLHVTATAVLTKTGTCYEEFQVVLASGEPLNATVTPLSVVASL